MEKPFKIGNEKILPGERRTVQLAVAALYDYTLLRIPIEVIRGELPGPTLFISAAIHGDEINGVEIIKRLMHKTALKHIRGTLILAPVVNVFGFNNKSRYLPDRRDLNRSFPGSTSGSLAARLAHTFMVEVVNKCTHGIDLHTGAIHRTNFPHIRVCLDDAEANRLAQAFGSPVIIHSKLRDGSLREAARRKKIAMLMFEGGEALRFDEHVIRMGLHGCLLVMKKIKMLPSETSTGPVVAKGKTYVARQTYWVRAPHSGSFRLLKKLGDQIADDTTLAIVSDPFHINPYEIKAKEGGVIIGMSTLPLVNRGDAVFHIATFKNIRRVKHAMDLLDDTLDE